jgi:hypothetical protein
VAFVAISDMQRSAKVYGCATSAIRQMSIPKRLRARTWRPLLPRAAGTPTPQKQHAGLPELDAQPSAARIRPPSGRGADGLPWCGELAFRTPARHRAQNKQPGRILIPGDGAAGDQEAQNRPACPAMAATRRLPPVQAQRLPGVMVSGVHVVL